jgi:hypothetical protein
MIANKYTNALDMQQRNQFLSSLKDRFLKDVNLEEAAAVLEDLAHEMVLTRRHLSMKGVRGAPDWVAFETELWQVSESLREFFRNNRELRGRSPLLDAVGRLAENPRFGKGRQNLVLMLGEFGRGEYGATLGKLLSDTDVYGHAIKALNQGKVLGYRDRVTAILATEKHGWIRSAAKKYLSLPTATS